MSYLDFDESINFEIVYKPDKNNINKVRIFGKIFIQNLINNTKHLATYNLFSKNLLF